MKLSLYANKVLMYMYQSLKVNQCLLGPIIKYSKLTAQNTKKLHFHTLVTNYF